MTGKIAAVCACIGVLLYASPSLAKDGGFGDTGQFIVSADRLFTLFSFTDIQTDEFNSNPTVTDAYQQTSFSLLVGGTPPADTFFTVPRVGVDYVLTSHLTVGGNIVLYTTLGGSNTAEPQGNPTTFEFGIAPRVGYVFQFTDLFSFWPRGGVSWYTGSTNGPGNGGTGMNQFALDIDPQLVITPVSHFGFTVGATTDIPLTGGHSATMADTTTSAHAAIFFLGATVGLLGYF